jgi:hypothetical protein
MNTGVGDLDAGMCLLTTIVLHRPEGARWDAGTTRRGFVTARSPKPDQARPKANAPAALGAWKRDDGTIDPGWRNALVGYFSILAEWSKKARRDEP